MSTQSTIYALATPEGIAGIAIIRISGKHSWEIALLMGGPSHPVSHRAYYVALHNPAHDKSQTLDYAILLYFASPNSFTGEDVVELQVHGSRAVVKDILHTLSTINKFELHIAEHGEFTRRAFENGKLTLEEVDALYDLIQSETSLQRQIAVNQLSGALKSIYIEWRSSLRHIMAQLEAFIDFSEDYIPGMSLQKLSTEIIQLRSAMHKQLKISDACNYIKNGASVAIIGAPNVGKSTLLNAIVMEDVAITSDIPGTTRDVISVCVDLDGISVTISDTAGLCNTTHVIEERGIQRALTMAQKSDIVCCVFDVTQDFENQNNTMTLEVLDTVLKYNKKCIVIINKYDGDEHQLVLKKKSIDKIFYVICNKFCETKYKKISLDDIVTVSAREHYGVDELLKKIRNILTDGCYVDTTIVTNVRQRDAIARCIEHLSEFLHDEMPKKPLDMIAQDVRNAADTISMISGEITTDDILEEIFARFCVGK